MNYARGGRPNTVILGDMNAEPGSPEMRSLANAGLIDAVASLATDPPLTFPSKDHYTRIDYIWTSRDLTPMQFEVLHSKASDHFPVVADIGQQELVMGYSIKVMAAEYNRGIGWKTKAGLVGLAALVTMPFAAGCKSETTEKPPITTTITPTGTTALMAFFSC